VSIVQLRGTGGSGKSTVVRRIMALTATATPVFEAGRRQPIGYHCNFSRPPTLYIPGHYETACGGCDTIKTPDRVYELVRAAVDRDFNVLYEGIIVQDDIHRCIKLNHERRAKNLSGVTVIELDTKIEDCLSGIQNRRDERGETKPLNPKNTVDRMQRVHRSCFKLRDAGVTVLRLSREGAFQKCVELLVP
jgi:hypothetical protein